MESQAQILVSSGNLTADMDFLIDIGFRLDNIFPDDSLEVAVMSGHGINIRLDKNSELPPVTINILSDNPAQFPNGKTEFLAPNGTQFIVLPKLYEVVMPQTQHTFEVRQLRDNDPWIIGRAGMLYRDLIPNRLGGSIMASHIRIPNGGPVPDMVHYHTIGFQLIFCYRGWVKLVYEDQGEPFILEAGDCVTQPPEIRHRVLEASDNLEVIEIGVPAVHMTTIDHDMELPTREYHPDREFKGQRFCHHKVSEAKWTPWKIGGFEYRDTGINSATKGIASVQVVRVINPNAEPQSVSHKADILFTFVMQGSLYLSVDEHTPKLLNKGDAFVIPPKLKYEITGVSDDLELLEVSLSGN
ncbi:MAG: cupin domain-containing protein [Flavobacteriales bacterium]|nr:cupin domain-containing protein [Flavobacteriales bacterium]